METETTTPTAVTVSKYHKYKSTIDGWKKKNPEKRAVHNMHYRETHQEELRAYMSEYRKRNKERIRLYNLEYQKNRRINSASTDEK